MTQDRHNDRVHYQRTQYGFAILLPVLLVAAPLLIIGVLSSSGGLIGSGVLLLFACLLFYRLVVTVRNEVISISFGIGLIKKRLPVSDIVAVRAVRNKWWFGWGVRVFPGGWLYNIYGLDAVELQMQKSPRYRIGTADPVGLASAIEARRAMSRQ